MDSVLNISEAANLALHAGMVLAQAAGKPVSARQMAESLQVSYDHLAKVLQRLTKAGLVRATRGPTGGFVLAKPAQRIRLLDLYQAIDGKFTVSRCLFGRKSCPGGTCIMGDLLDTLNHQVREHLAGRRLSDFVPGNAEEGAS
jgi:Rrf2 family protein